MTLEFHLGRAVDISILAGELGVDEDGASIAAIVDVARAHGLEASGVRIPWRSLPVLEPGSVLHWAPTHFVVLQSVGRLRVRLLDPSVGPVSVLRHRRPRQFGGVAVRLSAPPGLDGHGG